MPIVAKAENDKEFEKFPLPEAGTVQAVCAGVWDLGNQVSTWDGIEKVQHKCVIAWELAQLIDAPENEYHGQPYMLSKRYTVSLYENSNLRKDLESWRGAPFDAATIASGFDIETLYGVNCLLGVAHEQGRKDPSKTYANVTAILKLPKGMEAMKPVRAKDEAPPKWVVDLQAQSVEPVPVGADADDDTPDFMKD